MSARAVRATAEDDARDNLDALVRQRGEQYEPLSRMLGRRGGFLRKWALGANDDLLADAERYALARHFEVDARVLGAPAKVAPAPAAAPVVKRKSKASALERSGVRPFRSDPDGV
jgi:hypothetical protein